jgi:CBS domain-containing protein
MLVAELAAKDFMTKHVKTVYSDSKVSKAIDIMAQNNIGSVVVVDASGPMGVFTERDLLHHVLRPYNQLENMIVMEAMSKPLAGFKSDQTLEEAASAMIEKKGRLLVFEDGNLVGLITATDIVRELHKLGKKFDITKFISRDIVFVDPYSPITSTVLEMDEKRIGSVLLGHKNNIIGIFTERDLLRKVLAVKSNLTAPVNSFATKPVVTARLPIDGKEISAIMMENHIKRLPLSDQNGNLEGIITARDLVEAYSS